MPKGHSIFSGEAVILICMFALAANSVSPPPVAFAQEKPSRNKAEELVKLIEACPAWIDVTGADLVGGQRITECLSVVADSDTPTIREAVKRLVWKHEDKEDEMGVQTKVFLLNRLIFNVPVSSKRKESPVFGGWVGVPSDDETINLLWPFETNTDGKLELISGFRGYAGEPFEALGEFDSFNKRFGRRMHGAATTREKPAKEPDK
jgi:hypothetical protein